MVKRVKIITAESYKVLLVLLSSETEVVVVSRHMIAHPLTV